MPDLPTMNAVPAPPAKDVCDTPACSCGPAPAVAPPFPAAGSRVFNVAGLDCSEEVEALRREVSPLTGGPGHLEFDLMAGQMVVHAGAGEVSDEAILTAVRRAGLTAVPAGGEAPAATWWQRRGRVVMTAASGVFLAAGVLMHGLSSGSLTAAVGLGGGHTLPLAAKLAFLLSVFAGAWFIAPRAVRSARTLRPDMNLLMTVAVTGALLIGQWLEGATVAFLFAVSLLLESWSVGRARRAVRKLMELAPPVARLRLPDGSQREVSPDSVPVEATVVVHAGERIPLDGEIIEGRSLVDTSPVTGESTPQLAEPGSPVWAGTIALDGTLALSVTRPASNTVLAGIIRQVAAASRRRAKAERWVDRFALIYTPAVFAAAILTAVIPPLVGIGPWADWVYRALVLLVIGCPCALVISTPVSVVAGLAAAARHGVLVKGGDILEIPATLISVAMDKTGTLTTGQPEVVDVVPAEDHDEAEVLTVAAALEMTSTHPLGAAIVRAAAARGLTPPPADGVRALAGRGIEGRVDGRPAWLGSHRLLEERDQETPAMHERIGALAVGGRTVVAIGRIEHVCGFVALADAPRPEAAAAIQDLRNLGIHRIVMLTGDNPETAAEIGRAVGVKQIHASLLPEDKIARLEALRAEGPLAFVGDGINDAPALALADLGIAMGAGTDAAIETAHVALIADDLAKIPWLIRHSRHVVRIIRTNIVFALAVKAVFVILTFAGHASLWAAIAADMGASLAVIANGLRLLGSAGSGKTSDRTLPETRSQSR